MCYYIDEQRERIPRGRESEGYRLDEFNNFKRKNDIYVNAQYLCKGFI